MNEDAIDRKLVCAFIAGLISDDGERKKGLEYIRSMPPVNPTKTGWIPVSERLPNHDEYIKNNGLFNVSDGNRSYSEWFDIYDKQRFGEPTMSGFRVDYAVTAWMPLPESYKAESEE